MSDFRQNVRGIVAMLACCLFFILNDTMVKAVAETMPLGQAILLRGLVATPLVALVAWRMGALAHWRAGLSWALVWRTVGEIGATLTYLTALLHLPIANTSAIAQAGPLVMTAAGALLFGERVGWRRWAAVFVGFAGVMIIVRPGAEGFNAWSLLAFASVLLVALRDVATRYIPATVSTILVTTLTSAAVTAVGGVWAVTEPMVAFGWREILLVSGAGIMLLGGYACIVIAMRTGDISIVSPFRYSFIPYAIVIGWLVWGDVPDAPTVLGIVIVVATGIYTFWTERREARRLAGRRPVGEMA